MTGGGNSDGERHKKGGREEVRMTKDGKEGNGVKRNKCKRRRAAYNHASLRQ